MRRVLLAGLFGFGVAFLFAFSAPNVPARHAQVPLSVTVPQVYVHDPYTSPLISNVTPKPVGSGVSACDPTQAIGIYDDGGSIGVNCIDSFSGTSTAVTSTPSAPGTNQITQYAFQLDAGWPPMPFNVDNFFAVPQPAGLFGLFPYYSTTMKWNFQCWLPTGWNLTTLTTYNSQAGVRTAGSSSGVAWSSASLMGRLKFLRYTATAAANNSAGNGSGTNVENMWRGNTAGAGGWLSWQRWGVITTAANTRHFVGLMGSAAALPAAASDPNVVLDSVYVGCNAGDSNYSICSNDNSGTATCTTLGSSFPCTTNGAYYDLWLSAPPNASFIHFYLERLDSAAIATGDVTSDLPRNTVQLNWITWMNSGSSSTGVAIDWAGTCLVANL